MLPDRQTVLYGVMILNMLSKYLKMKYMKIYDKLSKYMKISE